MHPADRDALLLRFFEQQSLAQIGTRLGSNEDAARKRVQRALEKLRAILTKRGVTTTAAALSAAITANAMPAAPAGLALTLTHLSFAAAGTGTLTLLKIMTATKIKLAFSALLIAGAATALVVQHQTQNKLREENATQQHQIAQLQIDNGGLSNRLADTGDSKKLTDEQFNELLKLRGEVGVLRRQAIELEKNQATPQATTAIISRWLDTDEARTDFSRAIIAYAKDHNEQLPTSFNQLNEYLSTDSPTVLAEGDRFEFMVNIPTQRQRINPVTKPGDFNDKKILFRERSPRSRPNRNGSIQDEQLKIYGFTDGSVMEMSSNWLSAMHIGSFEDFESQHALLPPSQ